MSTTVRPGVVLLIERVRARHRTAIHTITASAGMPRASAAAIGAKTRFGKNLGNVPEEGTHVRMVFRDGRR